MISLNIFIAQHLKPHLPQSCVYTWHHSHKGNWLLFDYQCSAGQAGSNPRLVPRYPNQWSPIQSLFQVTPQIQHHSALHMGQSMCMQPPAGGDKHNIKSLKSLSRWSASLDFKDECATCSGSNQSRPVQTGTCWWFSPFLSTGTEHWGQRLVDSCRRSREAWSHLPLRDASSSTTNPWRNERRNLSIISWSVHWSVSCSLIGWLTCAASAVGGAWSLWHAPSWYPSLQSLQKTKPQPSCRSHSTLLLPSGGTSPAPQPGEGHISPPIVSRHSSAAYCRYRPYWDILMSDIITSRVYAENCNHVQVIHTQTDIFTGRYIPVYIPVWRLHSLVRLLESWNDVTLWWENQHSQLETEIITFIDYTWLIDWSPVK